MHAFVHAIGEENIDYWSHETNTLASRWLVNMMCYSRRLIIRKFAEYGSRTKIDQISDCADSWNVISVYKKNYSTKKLA